MKLSKDAQYIIRRLRRIAAKRRNQPRQEFDYDFADELSRILRAILKARKEQA